MENTNTPNRRIDQILSYELRLGKVKLSGIDLLFAVGVFVLSLGARIALFPIVTGDYVGLQRWIEEMGELGGLPSLGHEIGDYASAYMIILSLFSYLEADLYTLVKAFLIIFDYVCAFAVFALILTVTDSGRRALLGFCVTLAIPTALINAAAWGQCDTLYASFVLLGLCFFLAGHPAKAMWLTAVAFAFKLQAVFILPFYIIMWIAPYAKDLPLKALKLRHFLILPVPYVICALPGIFMGRDIWSSLGVYFEQTSYYPWLTLNYPNIYAFFGETYLRGPYKPELGFAGVFATIIVLGALAYFIYHKKEKLNRDLMISMALFSICIVLYGLPHMHERYGILIDILAIVWGLARLRRLPVAIGLIAMSLVAYMNYFAGFDPLPPFIQAIIQLLLIIYVGRDLIRGFLTTPKSIPGGGAKRLDTRN